MSSLRRVSRAPARGAIRGAFLAAACLVAAGCAEPPEEGTPGHEEALVAFGDLDEIRARGTLRLARRRWDGFETLPRQGLAAENYFALAESFAERHGLAYQWRVHEGFHELMPAVRDGRADVAVATITVTEARAREVAFTAPLTRTREWVLGRGTDGDDADQSLGALAHLTFGVPAGTAYLESLARYLPDAPVVELPAGADPHDVLEGLEAGRFDATVMDAVTARPVVAASGTVRRLAVLPEPRDLAWVVRQGSPRLRAALDVFLGEGLLVAGDGPARRDLAGIREAGRLRMLTLNGPGTYYLWRGELIGFEYELLRAFARSVGVTLEVVVATHREELMPWLAEGRGDVVSAGVTATATRRAAGGTFSTPYLRVQEVFVSRAPIGSLADLAGRRVTVQRGTSFVDTLERLGAEVDLEIERSPAESETLIRAVAAAQAEVTLADSHVAELEATFDERLSIGPRLPEEMGLSWVVRPDQPELLAALDAFIEARYRGYEYNVLRNKYFRNDRRMERQREHRLEGERLSPFDELVKRAAAEHDFDWRLLVSQMYQESAFDPRQVSPAGARGLMQVMPRTALEVGISADALADPAQGIEAGARYLAWTRERFDALPLAERLWFALAAYNAGVGHVRDARRLARVKGWDAATWFGHVEHAMLLLSEPDYARQALHGYVRGAEPVRYVGAIRDRYRAYLGHFETLREAPELDGSRS